jgi:hypothetical protein
MNEKTIPTRVTGITGVLQTAGATNNAVVSPEIIPSSAETLLLRDILTAIERLNVCMVNVDRSLSQMNERGVKVKF